MFEILLLCRVADLKERYTLLQLKKMLTKYELTQHNVLDKTTAQVGY